MLQITDYPALENEGPRSQTTLAYEAIRSDILNGRHLPERKLKIQELAVELDVSPGAVREALSRLVPEQLVLIDLTDLRCEIEAVALRRSVERADRDWEANILAAEHRLRGEVVVIGTDEPKLNPAWVRTHAAFHAALVSACGSRRLLALHAQLYEQSERYRGLSLHVEAPRNVTDEHHAIAKMALARDAENLIRTTVEHLRKTTDLIVAAAQTAATTAT
jgi:GntR family carbon starvation induced transcriptional regulator